MALYARRRGGAGSLDCGASPASGRQAPASPILSVGLVAPSPAPGSPLRSPFAQLPVHAAHSKAGAAGPQPRSPVRSPVAARASPTARDMAAWSKKQLVEQLHVAAGQERDGPVEWDSDAAARLDNGGNSPGGCKACGASGWKTRRLYDEQHRREQANERAEEFRKALLVVHAHHNRAMQLFAKGEQRRFGRARALTAVWTWRAGVRVVRAENICINAARALARLKTRLKLAQALRALKDHAELSARLKRDHDRWSKAAATYSRNARLLQRKLIETAQRPGTRYFVAWMVYVNRRLFTRHTVLVSAYTRRRAESIKGRAYGKWISRYLQKRQQSQKCHQIVARGQKKLLQRIATAMALWRRIAREQARILAAMRRNMKRSRSERSASALCAWGAYSKALKVEETNQKQRQERRSRMVKSAKLRVQAHVMESWQQLAATTALSTVVKNRMVQRQQRRQHQHLFMQWSRSTAEARCLRDRLERIDCLRRTRKQRKQAFNGWLDCLRNSRRLSDFCLRLVKRRMLSCVVKCLYRWTTCTMQRKACKGKGHKVRMFQVMVHFGKWLNIASERARARRNCGKFCLSRQRGSIRYSFYLWSSTFAEARRLEEAKTLENMLQQANAQSDAEKGEFEVVRKRLEGQYRSVQEECRILQNLCDEGKERWQEAERKREKQVQRCEKLLDREKKIQSELQALMRQVRDIEQEREDKMQDLESKIRILEADRTAAAAQVLECESLLQSAREREKDQQELLTSRLAQAMKEKEEMQQKFLVERDSIAAERRDEGLHACVCPCELACVYASAPVGVAKNKGRPL